ncbi:MAG: hypothetical protein Q4A32_06830, partial [Lachnospiraceae bacterium]|nr:hypothetical protein [Lachnospiraceae bacterium]
TFVILSVSEGSFTYVILSVSEGSLNTNIFVTWKILRYAQDDKRPYDEKSLNHTAERISK